MMHKRRLSSQMVIIVLSTSACGLVEEPLRVAADPQLTDLLDAEVEQEGDVGLSDVVSVPDVTLDGGGDNLGFECEPQCFDDQFCGPENVCYERSSRCVASGETCDPLSVRPSPTYVCEPLFGGRVGVCRFLCEEDDDCRQVDVCRQEVGESGQKVCRTACDQDEGACGPFDVCAGPGGFEVCLGFCPPYLADQCPEAQMCVVQEGLQGYCDVAGQAGLYESCQEQVCAEGLACAESGQGAVCLERCVPSAVSGGEGSCAQGQECEVIGGRDLGVCRHVCDLFDSARACPEAGQGCTVANEREGTCVFRGEFGLGNRCENSPQCQAPLQCLVGEDEGVCSRMCLRSAAEGEEGSCPEGKTCRMTGFGSLGVCR